MIEFGLFAGLIVFLIIGYSAYRDSKQRAEEARVQLEYLKEIEKHLKRLASAVYHKPSRRHGDETSISVKHWND